MIEPSPVSRQAGRCPIAAEVRLRRSGEMNYTVNAYDISERGCKVEFVERPWLGETVWVKFDGLEALRSTVRWTGDFAAGLEFEYPIDARVLETLMRRLS